jgi:hypothetical protein
MTRHPSPILLGCQIAKKYGDRYKGWFSFRLQVRVNMETVLIVLLVVFLLGGGGWGYSRWRG